MAIVNFTYDIPAKKIGNDELGFFEIDCVLNESYNHSNTITDIPVEEGANVTDNIISNSDIINISAFIGRAKFEAVHKTFEELPKSAEEADSGDPKARIIQSYLELKRIKESGQLITVVLGLDTFKNMVIESFNIDRAAATGKDLPFTMSFKKVDVQKSDTAAINASTSGSGTGGGTGGVANAGTVGTEQAQPQDYTIRDAMRRQVQRGERTQASYQAQCEKNGWPL